MLYAITYKDFKGVRKVMFDRNQAQIYEGSGLTNEKFADVQERLADLLDGSPVKRKMSLFKSTYKRTDYPREKIAFWRQCLQTLEIVPYKIEFPKEN